MDSIKGAKSQMARLTRAQIIENQERIAAAAEGLSLLLLISSSFSLCLADQSGLQCLFSFSIHINLGMDGFPRFARNLMEIILQQKKANASPILDTVIGVWSVCTYSMLFLKDM